MQTDLFLVLGVIAGALGFPALLNSFSESRFPKLAVLLFLASGALIVVAVTQRPGGYAMADIPHAFIRVIGFMFF